MRWQILSWHQEKGRDALQRGAQDDASLTGWGRLDDLMALGDGLGMRQELNGIHPELTREGSSPRWFIHRALWVRMVVGDERLNAMPEGLFREVGGLRVLGCTARAIREGFDPPHKGGEQTPWHGDSLRYSRKQTPVAAFYQSLTRCRGRWLTAGFITRRGPQIRDATKLQVDGADEGAGERTVIGETVEAQGQRHRRKVVNKGVQLVPFAYRLPKRKRLVVMASRVGPIPPHEVPVRDERLDAVVAAVGAGAIRRLRLDRGVLDGERLGRWPGRQMAVMVPVKHHLAVLADLPGLTKLPPADHIVSAARRGRKDAPGQPLDDVRRLGLAAWATLESSPGALKGLLVTACRGRARSAEPPWRALTTVPVRPAAAVLAACAAQDDRARVENTAERELTQGDRVPTCIGKEASAMAAPLFVEGLLSSVIALYQPQRASRQVAEGLRRLRRVGWQEGLEVVGSVGCWQGWFSVRECAPLLGRPPTGRLDDPRVRLRPRPRPQGRTPSRHHEGDPQGRSLSPAASAGEVCAPLRASSHGSLPPSTH